MPTLPPHLPPLPPEVRTVRSQLDTIERIASGCTKCSLHELRTNCVFGTGHSRADLMFVGEGAGPDEDLAGEAFVGKSGQLLDRIIKAMGADRPGVWLTNVVCCRLDNARHLSKAQVESCREFLEHQIQLVDPRVIVPLGATAWHWFRPSDKRKISEVRGRLYRWQGRLLAPTYHPAFLLRKPEHKSDVWLDMQDVIRAIHKPQWADALKLEDVTLGDGEAASGGHQQGLFD